MRIFYHLRRALSAPAIVSIALTGCGPASEDGAGQTDQNQAAPEPPLSLVDRPLDRSAFLQAVAKAGSAAALGIDDREEQRHLDGKSFEVRIRFGCPAHSGAADQETFRVQYRFEERALRLRAAPDLVGKNWFALLGGADVETVEGFWLPHPWLLTDGCPVPTPPRAAAEGLLPPPASENVASDTKQKEGKPGTENTASTAPRVGLAQLFRRSDSRTQRRDRRAYEATVLLSAAEQLSLEGYTLVLSGRLRQLPDGRVIACRVERVDSPPDCVASVAFDQVRIERADNRKVLAEWSS